MTELETKLLRELCGLEKGDGSWGAWVTAAVESLKGRGLVKLELRGDTLTYVPTDRGRQIAEKGVML